MKTISVLVFLFVFSITGFAQQDFSIKPLPKIDFKTGQFVTDTAKFSFESSKIQADFKQYFANKTETTFKKNTLVYNGKMPIAKPLENYWNMPVAVPDSTVNYAIREKRILFPEDIKFKRRK